MIIFGHKSYEKQEKYFWRICKSAFKKELRKITVKELCEKALINKSTFYTYYEDMFDLSDKIESEVVDGIVSTISNPQMMIDEPVKFYRNLLGAMTENKGTDKHGFPVHNIPIL